MSCHCQQVKAMIKEKELGQGVGPAGQDTRCQALVTSPPPQSPTGWKRKLPPTGSPLTSTQGLWHRPAYTHEVKNIIKFSVGRERTTIIYFLVYSSHLTVSILIGQRLALGDPRGNVLDRVTLGVM